MASNSTNTAESLSATRKDSYAEKERKMRKKAKLEALNSYSNGGTKSRLKCNKPTRSNREDKKSMVKACENGKEKLVHYGDPNMKIKKSNPERRKSFRARHKCESANDKMSARYWSCKAWKDGGYKK